MTMFGVRSVEKRQLPIDRTDAEWQALPDVRSVLASPIGGRRDRSNAAQRTFEGRAFALGASNTDHRSIEHQEAS